MDLTEISPMEEYALITVYLKGIRSLNLRRLLTLWFCLTYSHDLPLNKAVTSRVYKKGLPASHTNMAFELKPEDVMELLHCSKRTAYDYIRALQTMNL